jgi:hypothetical protein
VRHLRVLDRQVVEPELQLDLPEQLGGRVVEADPHEDTGLLERLADVGDLDIAHAAAFRIGNTGDHALHRTLDGAHGSQAYPKSWRSLHQRAALRGGPRSSSIGHGGPRVTALLRRVVDESEMGDVAG